MIIESIEANFRNLKDVKIKFGKNITIISGHNGTMKSTLLGLLIQPFNNSVKSSTQKYPQETYKGIDGQFLEGKFEKNIKFAYPEYDDENCLSVNIKFFNNDIGINGYYSYSSQIRRQKSQIPKLRISNDKKRGYGFIKDIPVAALYLDRLFPLPKINGEVIEIFESQLSDKEFIEYQELYKHILNNSENLLNISSFKSRIKNTANIVYENRDYRSMSSGEDVLGKILLMILSIKRVKEKLGDNYNGALFIIDEIEASLHPPIQRKLMELLNKVSSKYNIQFIITTHSLEIIEWCYKMRENTLKDLSTYNNMELIYLTKHENYIKYESNPSYISLKNHLFLISDETQKINIFVEDNEAKLLAENFLSPVFKNIKIIITELGCNELIRLVLNESINEINTSIILLDGDSRNELEKKMKSYNIPEKPKNIVFLPGDCTPEEYIIEFLNNLNSEHDFWYLNENKSYTKDHFSNSLEINMDNREIQKKWFNENRKYFEKEHNNIFKYILNDNLVEIENFNVEFSNCHNFIASQYLLEPINVEKYFDSSILSKLAITTN